MPEPIPQDAASSFVQRLCDAGVLLTYTHKYLRDKSTASLLTMGITTALVFALMAPFPKQLH